MNYKKWLNVVDRIVFNNKIQCFTQLDIYSRKQQQHRGLFEKDTKHWKGTIYIDYEDKIILNVFKNILFSLFFLSA